MRQPTTCQELAEARFLVAVAARREGPLIRVTGYPASAACGGPDGVRYDVGTGLAAVRLLPDASVTLVALSSAEVDFRSLAPAALPAQLAGDRVRRTFLVTGPWTAARGLTEQFLL
ncbi:hypothetical protein [Kineococcus rubinsiae]|uniref:hypothetical protein n=1 Tax=Kineococcus rubinsiae TaxID=2609562 RepID=UPI001431D99B|nr:hypothetical protein [Kineococcus rubinsiae]NIZ93549.1 hypothetical protein [Kineococcus rubinsiae]